MPITRVGRTTEEMDPYYQSTGPESFFPWSVYKRSVAMPVRELPSLPVREAEIVPTLGPLPSWRGLQMRCVQPYPSRG